MNPKPSHLLRIPGLLHSLAVEVISLHPNYLFTSLFPMRQWVLEDVRLHLLFPEECLFNERLWYVNEWMPLPGSCVPTHRECCCSVLCLPDTNCSTRNSPSTSQVMLTYWISPSSWDGLITALLVHLSSISKSHSVPFLPLMYLLKAVNLFGNNYLDFYGFLSKHF